MLLASEGEIIIYGGAKFEKAVTAFYKVTPDLAVLNVRTNPLEWTVPKVSSNIGEIPALAGHTADLVENHMIVTFGNNLFILNFPF